MQFIRTFRHVLSIAFVTAVASPCFGQYAGNQIDRGYNTPTFSPYLNLLRNNGGVGQNYYGLVRPQMEFAQQNQQLNQGLQQLQMQNQVPNQMGRMPMYGYSQLGVTGHPVIFNSFGNGQFTGGYTGMAGGGMGGGFGGGMGGGFGGGMGGGGFGGMQGANQFGQMGMGMGVGAMGGAGNMGMGFSGVSGHAAQFGGIGNTYRATGR